MIKPTDTRILLSLPIELKEQLMKEARRDYRSTNNYIVKLLIERVKP